MGVRFRVKELAEQRNMTQEDLARAANINLSAVIGVWRNRVTAPRFDTLLAIARALGVKIDDLYVETERGNSLTFAPAM